MVTEKNWAVWYDDGTAGAFTSKELANMGIDTSRAFQGATQLPGSSEDSPKIKGAFRPDKKIIAEAPSLSWDRDKNSPTYGKITVKAPSDYFNSAQYNAPNGLKKAFESISQNYKLSGGDYATTDPRDPSKTITLDKYLEDLQKSFPTYVGMWEYSNNVSKNTGGAINYSDNDVIRSQQYGYSVENGVLVPGKDTDLIVLPNDDAILNFFKGAESFDADSRTVNRKDFRAIWDRDHGLTDEEMLKLHALAVSLQETAINGAKDEQWLKDNGYTKEDMATLHADAAALLSAMAEAPNVNFVEGMFDIANNTIMQTGLTAVQNTADFIGQTQEFIRKVLYGDAYKAPEKGESIMVDTAEGIKKDLNEFMEASAILNSNATTTGAVASTALNTLARLSIDIVVGEELGKLALGGFGKTLESAASAIKKLDAARNASALSFYGRLTAGSVDTAVNMIRGANGLMKAMSTTNLVKFADGLYRAGQVIGGTARATTTVGKIIKGAADLLENSFVEGAVDAIIFDPELAFRYLSNTKDEEARNYFWEQITQNALFFGVGNAALFTVTQGMSTSIGKAINANAQIFNARVGASRVVRGVRDLARKIDFMSVVTHKTDEKLAKQIVDLQKKIDNIPKGNYRELQKASNKMRQLKIQRAQNINSRVADALQDVKKNIEMFQGGKTVKAVEDVNDLIMNASNKMDTRMSDIYSAFRDKAKNADTAQAITNLEDATLDVRKAEEALGIGNSAKVVSSKGSIGAKSGKSAATLGENIKETYKGVVAKDAPVFKFNRVSNNYVGGLIEAQLILDEAKVYGIDKSIRNLLDITEIVDGKEVVKGQRKAAEVIAALKESGEYKKLSELGKRYLSDMAFVQKIDDLEGDVTALKKALNNYADRLKKFWYYNNNYLSSDAVGLLSKGELTRLRGSGVFGKDGKDYAKLMREYEFNAYEKRRITGQLMEFDPRNIQERGDFVESDFADMNTIVYSNIFDNASALTKKEYVYSIADATGAFKKTNTLLDGEKTAKAVAFQKAEQSVSVDIDKAVSKLSANEDVSAFLNNIVIDQIERNKNALFKTKTPELEKASKMQATARMKVKEANVSDRISAVQGMDSAAIDESIDAVLPKDIPKVSGATADSQINSLEQYVNNVAFDKNGNVKKGYQPLLDKIVELSEANNLSKEERLRLLKQTIAANTPEIYNSKKAVTAAEAGERIAYNAAIDKYQKPADEAYAKALEISVDPKVLIPTFDDILTTAVNQVMTGSQSKQLFEFLGDNQEAVTNYLVAVELLKGKRIDAISANLRKKMRSQIVQQLTEARIKKSMTKGAADKMLKTIEQDANKMVNSIAEEFKKYSATWLDKLRSMANDAGYDKAGEDMFTELRKTLTEMGKNDQIIRTDASTSIARVLDKNGEKVYYELDPLFAGLINTRIEALNQTDMVRLEQATASLFRFGTTGMSLRSFMNQNFKDNISAFIAGRAFHDWAYNTDYISSHFGDAVNDFLKANAPELWKDIQKEGLNAADVLMRSEIDKVTGASEVSAYDFVSNRLNGIAEANGITDADAAWDKMNTGFNKVKERMRLFFEAPNNIRESTLRAKVYSNAFRDALERGRTIEQAQIAAEFFARNATTNFARQTYHLVNLTATVPYLRSAINGTKSFFRIASVDPVGVFGRLIVGGAIPVMAITANNLASKENAELYYNIPEYEREGSFIIIAEGQVFTIPIPEQLTSFISPFRHMVEMMHKANKGTFWELALNDAVGVSPIDFQGFTSVDLNNMMQDDFWKDRMEPGLLRLASQLLDPATKALLTVTTGKDLYTGRYIDTTHKYIDDDTGEVVTMDYTSSNLAKDIGSVLGGVMSAPIAEKVLGNLFGTAGSKTLEDIWNLLSGTATGLHSGDFSRLGELANIPERLMTDLVSPMTYTVYSLDKSDWSRATAQLYREKRALTAEGSAYSVLENKINSEKDPEKRAKYIAQRNDIQNEFYQKVLKMANGLIERGGTLTRQRYASIISLMNFAANDSSMSGTSNIIDSANKEKFQQGRAQALQTMIDMGFPESNDAASAFGYMYKDSDGNVQYGFTSPMALLNYNYTSWQQKDADLLAIKTIIDDNDLYDKNQEYWKQYNAIDYKDTAARSNVAIANNEVVFSALADYIAGHSPEEVLSHQDVINEIKKYIIVPDSYKVNNKGRKPTSLGDDGSLSDAYAETYIKRIFKMNDTKYDSYKDKNYSDE